MKKITIITIVLFSVGIASGLLILYNYQTSLHVIPRDQAIDTAAKFHGMTQRELSNRTVYAELLQPVGNGEAIIINYTTMTRDPFPRVVPLIFEFQENQLVWDVRIQKHLGGSEYQECQSFIDATNGTRLYSLGNC